MQPACILIDGTHDHLVSGMERGNCPSQGFHPLHEEKEQLEAADHYALLSNEGRKMCLKDNAEAGTVILTVDQAKLGQRTWKSSDDPKCISGAIDGHVANVTKVDIPGPQATEEELDDSDVTDMCYESVGSLPQPFKSSRTRLECRLDYERSYLESLSERDGILIEAVPASSPASFFQADAMHVPNGNSVVVPGGSWKDLHSPQQDSGYYTSLQIDSRQRGASDDAMFTEEPLRSSPLINSQNLGVTRLTNEKVGVRDFQPSDISPPGLLDTEKCQYSEPYTENTNSIEDKKMMRTTLLKEKSPLLELCLRTVLSDPMTGAFLDDAMVAQCGHSFGKCSLQEVMETQKCLICGAIVTPDSLVPNFALRAAVLAYKHEDQLQMNSVRGLKRRKELSELVEGSESKKTERVYSFRTERDHWATADNFPADFARSKAVQFPFAESDKVLIKQGNKRTPERFIGREAIITSQCLNGWYLVKTLDSGESVRLQYRSLQKLGDVDMPSSEYFAAQQCGDGSSSPMDLIFGSTKATAETGIEFESPATSGDTSGQHNLEEKINPIISAEKDFCRIHTSPSVEVGRVSNPSSGDIYNMSFQAILSDQERSNETQTDYLEKAPKSLDDSKEESPQKKERACQSVSDVLVEKFRTDLLNGIITFHDESGDDQLAQDGSQSDASTKLWIGAKSDFLDTHNFTNDPIGDAPEVGGNSRGNRDLEDETDILRTRSRRNSLQSRSSLLYAGCGQDFDPYRKVYSSGYRRRGGKGNSLVTRKSADLPADSKSSAVEQESGKSHSESFHGVFSGGKQGKDIKIKSSNEFLRIMRKDMLKLEKQIPRSYLSDSWRSGRVDWRKGVQASCTVLELGHLLREFRNSLLLTTAGGMSDEEWEKRLKVINESGDVDLLVSLWGRLYKDLYNCVELITKSDSNLAQSAWKRLLKLDAKDINDLNLSGDLTAPAQVTTATTGPSAEGGHQDTKSDLKNLLTSTMTLLQKQSRMELVAVKEALEQEKRHIMAKLAKLEASYIKLGSIPAPGTCATKGAVEISNGQYSHREPNNNKCRSSDPPSLSTPDNETDEGESDTALPSQDDDGEATDMSESD